LQLLQHPWIKPHATLLISKASPCLSTDPYIAVQEGSGQPAPVDHYRSYSYPETVPQGAADTPGLMKGLKVYFSAANLEGQNNAPKSPELACTSQVEIFLSTDIGPVRNDVAASSPLPLLRLRRPTPSHVITRERSQACDPASSLSSCMKMLLGSTCRLAASFLRHIFCLGHEPGNSSTLPSSTESIAVAAVVKGSCDNQSGTTPKAVGATRVHRM
jgi:hypothetical protein